MKKVVIVLGCAVALVMSGCSSREEVIVRDGTTITKTEVIEDDSARASYRGDDGTHRHVRTETVQKNEAPTTVIVKEDEDDSPGLFGIIGDIIALPFRAVGALFGAIF